MPKILISDVMDSIVEKILLSNNIEVNVKTNFTTDELIEEKSSILFFLIFPLAVAKTIFKSFNSDFSSGNGIIELIDW